MIEYIDIATAYTIDADWAGTATSADQDTAIFKANVYLNNKQLVEFEETPQAVLVAATELAKLALTESIFNTSREQVASTSVKAGPVSTSKTYAVPLVSGHDSLDYVSALLAPYLSGGVTNSVDLVRGG